MTRHILSAFVLPLLASLTACSNVSAPQAATEISPTSFFAGKSSGEGFLVMPNGEVDRRFSVQSLGYTGDDGKFVIEQTIAFDDGETRERSWRLAADGKDRWAGELTDASGKVKASASGRRLRLSYPLADVPMGRMTQDLYLQSDGITVINVGTVRVAGVVARRLHEVIVKEEEEPTQ